MRKYRTLLSQRTWMLPVLLIVGLATVLPTIYLASTIDPQEHLSEMPVGLVVETPEPGSNPDSAAAVAAAVEAQVGTTLSITRMSHDELDARMADDDVAGAIVIPADFDASIASLYPGADVSTPPTISILTNAGDGGLSAALLVANATPILHAIADKLGRQLMQGSATTPIPAANSALLAHPFTVVSVAHRPLPAHAGLGTSAFYYALVLVLLGFIGASLVNPLVDSALGFLPSEIGPLVARRPYVAVSRRATYLGKVGILLAAAPLAALAVQAVAHVLGVTTGSHVTLWLYSTTAIAAVGTSAIAVFATFGPGIGALVNTLFFVALSMVSSGGTVPLEATPTFFRWFSAISPFRHVVDGTRALFYFDGSADAGLTSAWITIATGGAIGLMLGLMVTSLYGRVRVFSRDPELAPTA